MVRVCHIYQDIQIAEVNEELRCQREPFNLCDPVAVAAVKEGTVVGKRYCLLARCSSERLGQACARLLEVGSYFCR